MKAMAQWNDELKQSLIDILQSSERPEDTFDFIFLDGFVRATCCVPDFLSPLNWSGAVFAHQDPNFKDETEMALFHSALFALFNKHLDEVLEGECLLPVAAVYQDDPIKRVDLENWCGGFLTGYYLYQEIWDEMLEAYPEAEVMTDIQLEPLADQIESLVIAIKSILDPEIDLADGLSIDYIKESFEFLPEHIGLFGIIGQAMLSAEAEDNVDERFEAEYQQALEENEEDEEDIFAQFESFQQQNEGDIPFIRDAPKIGRNDPCACGSGKKFKKCCLH